MSDEKIGINEAAEILGVHPNTIRNYIASGYLVAYELPSGKRILLEKRQVQDLIKEKKPLRG